MRFARKSPRLQVVTETERGGPQHIPRPDRWSLGDPAPWPSSTQIRLDTLERRLATRPIGYQ